MPNDDQAVLARIAWLYYHEDRSQQEIAQLLGLSRIKVLRLLKVIREKGIVEIRIRPEYVALFELQEEFARITGLRDVTIVPSDGDVAEAVAYAGGLRFAALCERHERIGLGSSRAVSSAIRMLEAPPPAKRKVRQVVSLTGNTMANYSTNASNMNDSANILARLLGIDFFQIWAPAIASSPETCALIRGDFMVGSVLEKANSVECAFIGIGDLERSVLVSRGLMTEVEAKNLADRGAVGDIFTHFFDIDGTLLKSPIEARTITATVPMRCPVTALAWGLSKIEPITGAIRGRLIDALVTDETTARAVLQIFTRGRAR